jgi:hypothetical protein
LVFPVSSQNTEFPKLYVLTCGVANPLYATFGHTAIRYYDPEKKVDNVYNFGTFDPDTHGFYFKFLGGKLDYSLSVTDYEVFLNEYRSENRTIWEQELNFSPEMVCAVFDSLQVLTRPEFRNYRYNFFNNNCTTRVKDIIFYQIADTAILNRIQKTSDETWRHALKSTLEGRSWLSVGINILAGPFADKKITRYEKMFLPAIFMEELVQNGISGNSRILYQSTAYRSTEIPLFTPMIILWILLGFFVIEALWLKASPGFSMGLDQILFGFTGVLGLFFLCLWIWSDHIALRYNLNIIWANPLNIFVVWMISRVNLKSTKVYLFLFSLLLFFLIINWTRLPQKFPLELMPLITILAFRAINRVFHLTIKKNVNNL